MYYDLSERFWADIYTHLQVFGLKIHSLRPHIPSVTQHESDPLPDVNYQDKD